MRQTKIKIKNVLGIKHLELDGKSIELSGANGVGKTTILHAIIKGLTNTFPREVLITKGENEAEIFIETDSGLTIDRKIRANKSDYLKVKEAGTDISSPQSYLNTLFTPLQLDPIKFIDMSRQEKNRILLDLIKFDWDLRWIEEQFGEIPKKVDYSQNILKVLHDIQSDKGYYFTERQLINSEELHKRKTIKDIADDIPDNFQLDKWEKYSVSEKASELTKIQQQNNVIERAKQFKSDYENKIKGFEADKLIAIQNEKDLISSEKQRAEKNIERLKAEIVAEENKLLTLDDKLKDKVTIAESVYNEQVAKLDGDIQKANQFADKKIIDITPLQQEIKTAETMKDYCNEYKRMLTEIKRQKDLLEQSKELTRKIELARELPAQILKDAEMPIADLTIVDGEPLINGLPVDNLSTGQQLMLCVDVSIAKTESLQIILIDGIEKLSTKNKDELYAKCKEKGLQFIATRTTDSEELIITEF